MLGGKSLTLRKINVNVQQVQFGMVMAVRRKNNAKMVKHGIYLNLCVNVPSTPFGMEHTASK